MGERSGMTDWQENKKWSDQFIPEIKSILGYYLIGPAPEDEDREHNTDLIVLSMRPVRIACRVRRFKYWRSYRDEFTIRCSLPNGYKTELTKIIEGFGDYLFYGFADEDEFTLHAWALAQLNTFRLWHSRQLARSGAMDFPGIQKPNHDGSSEFRAFKWLDFPGDFVIASKNIPVRSAA
jgi:hypothetical protein